MNRPLNNIKKGLIDRLINKKNVKCMTFGDENGWFYVKLRSKYSIVFEYEWGI